MFGGWVGRVVTEVVMAEVMSLVDAFVFVCVKRKRTGAKESEQGGVT